MTENVENDDHVRTESKNVENIDVGENDSDCDRDASVSSESGIIGKAFMC